MKIKIENKIIGEESDVFYIAEAGGNHNGSIKIAKKLVDIAKKSGADAIKFQSFMAVSNCSKLLNLILRQSANPKLV